MYNGPSKLAADYFAEHDLACPADETIADHLLDVVTQPQHIESLDVLWRAQHDALSVSFVNTSSFEMLQAAATDDVEASSEATRGSRLLELQVLFVRAARTLWRNRALFIFHVVLSVVLGLVAGGIFSGLKLNLAGFQNRMGAFYFVLTFLASAQYYAPWSYFMSKTLLDLVSLRILPAVLFAAVFYYIMGLNPPADRFLLFTSTLVLFNVAAGSLSLLVSTVSKTVGIANLVATVVLLLMLLFGGFLLNVQTMPSGVAPIQWLSLFKYAFEIMMTNELKGLLLSFDAPGYPAIPIYGEVFLQTIGQDVNNQTQDVCCLIAFILGLNLISYMALHFQVPKRTMLHMAPNGRSPIPVLDVKTHHQ
ncbi:hypothetical protein SPRG_18663 [Saprolegnia parasitica CBS 223.65]|uniref:ABC-2 type transporter transmembrane domain-containing protein n=1 Tax=Saprolegnia parasitica (strain CBS 223.65) TaxID=695850 RepID=A0A067BN69_SAPPC|nr:hypothetical protein SPRG_18663 [Saprolegnia parasitica CBS 223.65]KDO15801.1 hypothetical protein SPRG_18663 [Saprolegnia parasitica CBS 223.65]|eukprot:XP_012213491.1 hypothetical protein SPRG_18663 [Saprolegnia parasitica CBS 223.65]